MRPAAATAAAVAGAGAAGGATAAVAAVAHHVAKTKVLRQLPRASREFFFFPTTAPAAFCIDHLRAKPRLGGANHASDLWNCRCTLRVRDRCVGAAPARADQRGTRVGPFPDLV